MTNFWLLFKTNLLSLVNFNGKRKKSVKVQATKLSVVALLFVIIVGGIGALYSFIFADVLKLTGKIDQLVPTMIGLSSIVAFAFSFYAVANLLYGFKDYDFLASLPVRKTAIILSKLSAMFLVDVAFSLLITIPAIVFYGVNATITFSFIAQSLICAVVSPLLPLTISIVIGALFTFISARIKFKNLVTSFLYLLVFALAFIVGFSSSEDGNLGLIQKIYFVLPLLTKGCFNVGYLFAFIGVNIIPFALVIWGVSLTFEKMNALCKARPKNKNFNLKSKQGKGELHTLFVKEFKRLATCPLYMMNSLIGCILPIVGVIALAIMFNGFGGEIASILGTLVIPFAPALLVFCFCIAPTTYCAISIEGSAFWLMRTLPIDSKKLLNAKIMVHCVFFVPCAVICSVVLAITFKLNVWLSLLFTAFSVILALFSGVFGLWANLKKPMLDWDNIQKPVKQSTSVLICMLLAFALSAVFGVIGYFMMFGQNTALEFLTKLSLTLYFGILSAVFIVVTAFIYLKMIKNAENTFAKIIG